MRATEVALIIAANHWEEIVKALGVACSAPVDLGDFDWRSYRKRVSELQQNIANAAGCDFKNAQQEMDKLQAALIHISHTCIQCPDTAQFALRVVQGSALPPKKATT